MRRPVADLVGGAVPDLRRFVDADPPLWSAFADGAAAQPVVPDVIVGHSGAGAMLPAICERYPEAQGALVFVDAVLPPQSGHYRTLPQMRTFLDDRTADGVLRRWPAVRCDLSHLATVTHPRAVLGAIEAVLGAM